MSVVDLPDGRQVTTRSSLESRWAIFFTSIGLKWKYEPKTFRFDRGVYTPDFEVDGLGFVEIKPTLALFISETAKRIETLSREHPKLNTYAFISEMVSFDHVALFKNCSIFAPKYHQMNSIISKLFDPQNAFSEVAHDGAIKRVMRFANSSKLCHIVSVGKVLEFEVVPKLERIREKYAPA